MSKWRASGPKLLRFAEEFYANFTEDTRYRHIAEHAVIYIGHPSSWGLTSRQEYQSLFRDSRNKHLRNAVVKPESRAALVHAYEHSADKEAINSTLVIDIGSSTIDFTYVKNLVPYELDLGNKFGARLIDQQLLNYVIDRQPDPEIWRGEYGKLIEIYEDQAELTDRGKYLLYLCRKAKERFFSGVEIVIEEQDSRYKPVFDEFWDFLRGVDINQILERPLVSLAGNPLDGSGKSWKAQYLALLAEAKNQLISRNLISWGHPKLIIFTGGGSRMPFTLELCHEVFGATPCFSDTEPSLSVSKGLAQFGRRELLVRSFRESVKSYCCPGGELEQDISTLIEVLGKNVIKIWGDYMVPVVIRPLVDEIKAGTISARQFGEEGGFSKYSITRFTTWFETYEGYRVRDNKLDGNFTEIKQVLNKKIQKICENNGIEEGKIRFDLKVPLEFISSTILVGPMISAVEAQWKVLVWGAEKTYNIPVLGNALHWATKVVLIPEDWFKKLSTSLVTYSSFSKEQKRLYLELVQKEISKQLEEWATQAERLLVESSI
jgi:hypothetical protein